MKGVLIIVWLFVLAGCSSQPDRISSTGSGWPEITIISDDKQAIKELAIGRIMTGGWVLVDESENSLLFTKVDDSGSMNSVFTQALIGNQYSTPPLYEARYALSTYKGETKIFVTIAVSTQMAMGQTRKVMLKDNATFNSWQGHLNLLKKDIESE